MLNFRKLARSGIVRGKTIQFNRKRPGCIKLPIQESNCNFLSKSSRRARGLSAGIQCRSQMDEEARRCDSNVCWWQHAEFYSARPRSGPRVRLRRLRGEVQGRHRASVPTAASSFARRPRAKSQFAPATCLTARPARCWPIRWCSSSASASPRSDRSRKSRFLPERK